MLDKEMSEEVPVGDLKQLEELCSATWEPLYRFIYYKVQNREEAEDIIQETYIKAISHLRKDNTRIEKELSFLKAVSLNILKDRWRKRKRLGTALGLEEVNPEEIASEDSAEASTQRALIENALSRLSEEQQTVVELRIIKGYTAAETAKIMKKKEGTVRVLQHRALQALAQILGSEGT